MLAKKREWQAYLGGCFGEYVAGGIVFVRPDFGMLQSAKVIAMFNLRIIYHIFTCLHLTGRDPSPLHFFHHFIWGEVYRPLCYVFVQFVFVIFSP